MIDPLDTIHGELPEAFVTHAGGGPHHQDLACTRCEFIRGLDGFSDFLNLIGAAVADVTWRNGEPDIIIAWKSTNTYQILSPTAGMKMERGLDEGNEEGRRIRRWFRSTPEVKAV
jgi:hypothetical protein